MPPQAPLARFTIDRLAVEIHADRQALGGAAARWALDRIRAAFDRAGRARLIIGTGASQTEVIAAAAAGLHADASRLEIFHMDEYVGVADTHPASFRRWLGDRVAAQLPAATIHYLAGDAPDPREECRRYAALLAAAPVDVCFAGFGENGHLAFNDPHEADFEDPFLVRPVTLDERCRAQQVADGCFPALEAVPTRALTITCPAILRSRHVVASVPGARKARAVRDALLGPVSTACPASILRTHADAALFLDCESGSLLGICQGKVETSGSEQSRKFRF